MGCNKLKDGLRNAFIHEKLELTLIEISKGRTTWGLFVHLQLRLLSALFKNIEIVVEGVVRSRGRPEETWIEV